MPSVNVNVSKSNYQFKQEDNKVVKPKGDEEVLKPEEPKNKKTSGLSNKSGGFIG